MASNKGYSHVTLSAVSPIIQGRWLLACQFLKSVHRLPSPLTDDDFDALAKSLVDRHGELEGFAEKLTLKRLQNPMQFRTEIINHDESLKELAYKLNRDWQNNRIGVRL